MFKGLSLGDTEPIDVEGEEKDNKKKKVNFSR